MLVGEPGGKTCLAQELASFAEEQGVQVLWGWCYEGEGAPHYWPWLEPVRSLRPMPTRTSCALRWDQEWQTSPKLLLRSETSCQI